MSMFWTGLAESYLSLCGSFNHRGYQGHVCEITALPLPPSACFPVTWVYPRIPRATGIQIQPRHSPLNTVPHTRTHTHTHCLLSFSTVSPSLTVSLFEPATGDFLFSFIKKDSGEPFLPQLPFKDHADFQTGTSLLYKSPFTLCSLLCPFSCTNMFPQTNFQEKTLFNICIFTHRSDF